MIVTAKSTEERSSLIAIAQAIGLVWHGTMHLTPMEIEAKYPFRRWPNVSVDFDAGSIFGTNTPGCPVAGFLAEVSRRWDEVKPRAIKLNEEYTAVVTDKVVAVGCQSIPHCQVIELAEAIERQ